MLTWMATAWPLEQLIGVGIGAGVVLLLLFIVFIKRNLIICEPNEVVIISGRKRKQPDGTYLGYRILRGGRGFKFPIVETVRRLPLNSVPINLKLSKALCAGLIPINIECRAQIKVAGTQEKGLGNAIERFLGKHLEQIAEAARETLSGNLRGVLAAVTPEEANIKRTELAKQVSEQASTQLEEIGIVLDFFQIQDISDDNGYLEAIGRKKNALVLKEARIAEATADAEARIVKAEEERKGRVAEANSKVAITDAENNLAVHRAELEAKTKEAQDKIAVAGRKARILVEEELEEARVARNRKRYEANVVVPAKAERDAEILKAEGKAAKIVEDGKATAEAIRLMKEQWEDGKTRDLFLIQLLPELLDQVTRVIADNLHIEKLTVVDSGDGSGVPSYLKNLTSSTVAVLEELKNATGINIPELLQRKDGESTPLIPKELP